jgi:small multidrug resistance pump
MIWIYLILAILTEVFGTIAMKVSHGFTKLIPSILVFILYGLSLIMLTLALKGLDVSIAYAIWAGMGTALITVIGIIWFNESISIIKIISVMFIIIGVVGLNLSIGSQEEPKQPPKLEQDSH